jgi:ATP-dependent Clp protease ATP-binding subunit ClpC
MASADFWDRPARFATLARFALMDRVRAAAETAEGLRTRLARSTRPGRPYSPELIGRLALQVHLVKEGIEDALGDQPIEVALAIEPVFDGSTDRQATLAWCGRTASMYRAWSDKRRMHRTELAGPTDGAPVLVVSGFGASRTLAREAGLHVFERSEGAGPGGRVTARVRIAAMPLGDLPPSQMRKAVGTLLQAGPPPSTIVRRYREAPPLVRDGAGTWRSGRLDLVLGGDFDLLAVVNSELTRSSSA